MVVTLWIVSNNRQAVRESGPKPTKASNGQTGETATTAGTENRDAGQQSTPQNDASGLKLVLNLVRTARPSDLGHSPPRRLWELAVLAHPDETLRECSGMLTDPEISDATLERVSTLLCPLAKIRHQKTFHFLRALLQNKNVKVVRASLNLLSFYFEDIPEAMGIVRDNPDMYLEALRVIGNAGRHEDLGRLRALQGLLKSLEAKKELERTEKKISALGSADMATSLIQLVDGSAPDVRGYWLTWTLQVAKQFRVVALIPALEKWHAQTIESEHLDPDGYDLPQAMDPDPEQHPTLTADHILWVMSELGAHLSPERRARLEFLRYTGDPKDHLQRAGAR